MHGGEKEETRPAPGPSEATARRRARQAVLLMALLGATVAAVVYLFPPSAAGIYWDCPFHEVTGLYCAGCGGQRALHALLHGRLLEALSLNAPALLFFAPLGVYVFVGQGLRALGFPRAGRLPSGGRWWVALIAMLVLFGLLRNLPWAPFEWFAP